jgi:hypothetical protein
MISPHMPQVNQQTLMPKGMVTTPMILFLEADTMWHVKWLEGRAKGTQISCDHVDNFCPPELF